MVQGDTDEKPGPWLQLSGHVDYFFPLDRNERVAKWIKNGDFSEYNSYMKICNGNDPLSQFVPQFHGILDPSCAKKAKREPCFVLSNVLARFKDPIVMDIKMGKQTFVKSEEGNELPRRDLFQKISQIAGDKLLKEELRIQKITKLRYLTLRDSLSTSANFGFRIEALNKGSYCKTTLANVNSTEEAAGIVSTFMKDASEYQKSCIISKLESFQSVLKRSPFCITHNIVASSLLVAYDVRSTECGLWFIDFFHALPTDLIDPNSGIILGAANLSRIFTRTMICPHSVTANLDAFKL
jgi:1D-myo-inositol-triphosphate 3-kinase